MLLLVDRHSGIPAYRQIMDQIRFQITSGILNQGDEMPSTRKMSAELGLNPMTISKAYGYLEKEGVLERRPGRPLIVGMPSKGSTQGQKLEQLNAALAPVVVIARQLGLETKTALETFEQLLNASSNSEGENS